MAFDRILINAAAAVSATPGNPGNLFDLMVLVEIFV